jgi:Transposase IS66 family
MDKATDANGPEAGGDKGGRSTRRRGSQLDKLTIDATVIVRTRAPAGSRRKGYEDIVVQDLSLHPQVTRYRRERWETPAGETLLADLAPGIVGGYGPNLQRFVLALHFSGQVACDRMVALLNGMGVVISKRQVVRLLTAKLETFRAEDEAVLKAGLRGAYVTVDDTGARHAGKNGYATQIGSDRFCVFRTGPTKSRLAFLTRLCGGASLYVINDAALESMKERGLPQIVIDKFANHKDRIFHSPKDWERHLQALGLNTLKVTPDPVLIAGEGALWGAIRHQGLLQDAVVVSDDAGQFRIGVHALCWVHAERRVHKLIPANDKQRNAIEIAKRMIWWFYRALKDYKRAPSPEQAQLLRARFDRIFNRARTGYATLDNLLRRLYRNKDDLLRVLERPDIPLNTNASENDIRAFVTKRKISGGTVSNKGRDARDTLLGLAKTCSKLNLTFFQYLGARLGIAGPTIPPLASLVQAAQP